MTTHVIVEYDRANRTVTSVDSHEFASMDAAHDYAAGLCSETYNYTAYTHDRWYGVRRAGMELVKGKKRAA